jgi:CBS domain-containing protein
MNFAVYYIVNNSLSTQERSMSGQKISKVISKNLLTVRPEASLIQAYQLLGEHEIRHLPVATEQGIVVGIISDRDFLLAQLPDSHRDDTQPWPPNFAPGAKVADFMTTDLKVISIDGDVKEAIEFMINMKISSCLVAKENMIVGIVTTEDLLVLLKSYLENPSVTLKDKIENYILSSPLGTLAHQLANAGI